MPRSVKIQHWEEKAVSSLGFPDALTNQGMTTLIIIILVDDDTYQEPTFFKLTLFLGYRLDSPAVLDSNM